MVCVPGLFCVDNFPSILVNLGFATVVNLVNLGYETISVFFIGLNGNSLGTFPGSLVKKVL